MSFDKKKDSKTERKNDTEKDGMNNSEKDSMKNGRNDRDQCKKKDRENGIEEKVIKIETMIFTSVQPKSSP